MLPDVLEATCIAAAMAMLVLTVALFTGAI